MNMCAFISFSIKKIEQPDRTSQIAHLSVSVSAYSSVMVEGDRATTVGCFLFWDLRRRTRRDHGNAEVFIRAIILQIESIILVFTAKAGKESNVAAGASSSGLAAIYSAKSKLFDAVSDAAEASDMPARDYGRRAFGGSERTDDFGGSVVMTLLY